MSKKNLEGKVAETLLQDKIKVAVGQRTFKVHRPTLGTLTLVAEDIAKLPEFSDEEKLAVVLSDCVHGKEVARILATLIIGAKKIKHPGLLALWPFRETVSRLTDEILCDMTCSDIWTAVTSILSDSELDDFFALTTFLRTANLASARKVVESMTKTTASGQ